jgi:hypothetical protein
MKLFKTLAMVGLVGVSALTAAEPVVLEQQNEVEGVTNKLLPPDQTVRCGDPLKSQRSYVVDGALMVYNPLISNEEQIFKRCARF